jgi:tRNA pseudouridine55 synthase
MDNGILLIDKPANMTSFGVVARVRRVLSKKYGKKMKVGHTGTLDPFATGLMILVIGKECKNAGQYTKLDKIYEATIRLGQTSTTGDPEGDISEVSDKRPSIAEVEQALAKFTGQITQTPPIYSAIKVNGQRAYKLARSGSDVEIPERTVNIYSLELISYDYPELTIRAHVSSGTYIRTLAEDIGKGLGVGAYCKQLRRTQIDKWSIADAESLDDFMYNNTMDYTAFLDTIFADIKDVGIDVSGYVCDHIGVRCASFADYERLKSDFTKVGTLAGEAEVVGRPISIFKLNQPIVYKGYVIPALELPAPKEGDSYQNGPEHVEFVITESFDEFMAKYPNVEFETYRLERSVNPELKLYLPNKTSVKFHKKPVLEVLEIQQRMGEL